MNNINYIESKGFTVKGRYILKADKSNKVAGILNENNFYLFKENCYPFKSGINFFDNGTIVDHNYISYIKEAKANERNDFNIDFEQYFEVTQENSTFLTFLNNLTNDYLSKDAVNYYDLRGVYSGYMANSVCFPFLDYNTNFVTAQIIKYDKTGKRNKGKYGTTWLHSYSNIKEDLILNKEDKYSVSVRSFFGEHTLNGSENIVAIVEAPKTAVILKEFFPNIDWIATAGETQIKNKKLDVLKGKRVVLFPDAHTTLWNEFAEQNGFYCSNVLDDENVKEGDDLADHFLDVNSSVYEKIHNQLSVMNSGKIDLRFNINFTELNYFVKGDSTEYFTAFQSQYRQYPILLKIDNSEDFKIVYKGSLFQIYELAEIEGGDLTSFQLYDAQVDWHKVKKDKSSGEAIRFFNEKEFVHNLEGSFRILKALNKSYYKEVFESGLYRLKSKSNFIFNIDYVLEQLVPLWDSTEKDLTKWRKKRDWKYIGGEQLSREEFIKALNDAKFKSKLKVRLWNLSDALTENRFIDLETDLALKSNIGGYGKIKDLVKQWNENVIGAKTYKTYINKADFFSKIKKCTKNIAVHIEANIYTATKNVQNEISVSKAVEITGVKNRKTVKEYLNFSRDTDAEKSIRKRLRQLIQYIELLEPLRSSDNRIIDFCEKKMLEEIAKENEVLKEVENKENLAVSDVFKPLEELTAFNVSKYSENQKKALKDEIFMLSRLREFNALPTFERMEILKENDLKNDFFSALAQKEKLKLEFSLN